MLTFVELDTFLCLHGPGTVLEACAADTPRRRAPSASGSPSRAAGSPAFFITELAQVVALCDEQIPCAALCSELSRQNVPHGGAAVDPRSVSRRAVNPKRVTGRYPAPACSRGQTRSTADQSVRG